jgi:hypothetical protein
MRTASSVQKTKNRSRRNVVIEPQPEIRKATPIETRTWKESTDNYIKVFLPVILRKVFEDCRKANGEDGFDSHSLAESRSNVGSSPTTGYRTV